MYESMVREPDINFALLSRGVDPALLHVGDHRRPLQVHERQAGLWASGHHPDLDPRPHAMARLADPMTLRAACDDLQRHGGDAPGPNGHRLADLSHGEIWSLCRALSQAMREGRYRPGRERKQRIPKPGRNGFRELTLQNIEDRIVARAALLVLQPLVEPWFSPCSFGWRPARNRLHALGALLALARTQKRWVWVVGDITTAFDVVPFGRLLQVCGTRFPADVVTFIELVSATGHRHGVRQGSPLSPCLMNLYLDHFLDRPWHRRHPDRPLLRTADDLLIACADEPEAAVLATELQGTARDAGVSLKPAPNAGVHNLADGQSVQWLGFLARREGNRLAIRIGGPAWDKLRLGLVECHLRPLSPVRAVQTIRGWLAQQGPSSEFENHGTVFRRLADLAGSLAFDEIPCEQDLTGQWHAAFERWEAAAQREAARLPKRLQSPATAQAWCRLQRQTANTGVAGRLVPKPTARGPDRAEPP